MGFFTEPEIENLTIQRMSLHVVGGGLEFAPRDELEVVHNEFLLGVIKSIAADPVYRFNAISAIRAIIEAVTRDEQSFNDGAQALAHHFHQLHDRGRTSEGAFFVFELGTMDERIRLYALIKYDYRRVLELQQNDGVATLREIVEALVNDKSAVQKSAIIRIVNGRAEPDLSTQDRMSRRKPDLTDFFQRYLEASRARDDEELTRGARNVVQETLRDTKEQHGQAVPQAVARANEVLRNAPVITEDVIRNAVWAGAGHPDDAQVREALDRATGRHITRNKLGDCEFNTARQALPRSLKKRILTAEGVTIEYDTTLDGGAVRQQQLEDGRTIFVIETLEFSQDVLPVRAR